MKGENSLHVANLTEVTNFDSFTVMVGMISALVVVILKFNVILLSYSLYNVHVHVCCTSLSCTSNY